MEKYHGLQELYAQLSSNHERGLIRATAIDQKVDSFLCHEIVQQTNLLPPINTPILYLTLEALDILWTKQSTTQRRKDSRLKGLDVLPYLLTLWKSSVHDRRIATPILSIFRSWAKIQDAQIKSILLKAGLVKSAHTLFRNPNACSSLQPQYLGFMKDLIFRAEVTEKEYMLNEWLQYVLSSVADEDCAEKATACLWNWAVEDDLAEQMAKNEKIWPALVTIFAKPRLSITTQRNALSVLGIMVGICTARFEDGAVRPLPMTSNGGWAVDHLFQVLQDAEDADLRRRAIRTVRCLSMRTWGRSILQSHFGGPSDLIRRLTQVLLQKREQDDTRVQACLALTNFLPHLHEYWSQLGPYVEGAVVQVVQEEKGSDKLVMTALQAVTTCLEFSPWKRGEGCVSIDFFQRVADLLQKYMSDPSYHKTLALLIWYLVQKRSSNAEQLVIAFPVLADLMSTLLTQTTPEFDISREKAIKSIGVMIEDTESKKCFIEHETLLTNLVNVCIVSAGEQKAEAKTLLVSLVSDL